MTMLVAAPPRRRVYLVACLGTLVHGGELIT